MSEEIVNARIIHADVEIHLGMLSVWITLGYEDGTGQGFGGRRLEGNHCAEFLRGVMDAVGVEKWSALKEKKVRVRKTEGFFGTILAIGHKRKDRWYP